MTCMMLPVERSVQTTEAVAREMRSNVAYNACSQANSGQFSATSKSPKHNTSLSYPPPEPGSLSVLAPTADLGPPASCVPLVACNH
jgi:hypothetical protein